MILPQNQPGKQRTKERTAQHPRRICAGVNAKQAEGGDQDAEDTAQRQGAEPPEQPAPGKDDNEVWRNSAPQIMPFLGLTEH